MSRLRTAQSAALRRMPPRYYVVALTGWRSIKRVRRRVAERLGVRRYSRPGLFDLDRKLQTYLPPQGNFVEAGANDGYRQSNSYYLERWCGWSGLLVEPLPRFAAQARRDRRVPVVCAALVAPDYTGSTITIQVRDLMSGVGGSRDRSQGREGGHEVRVPARTLSDILDDAGIQRVEFLSLDVEGYEASALAGLTRHSPRFVLVEIDGDRQAVEQVLGDRYRLVAKLSFHDFLYECELNLDPAMRASLGRGDVPSGR